MSEFEKKHRKKEIGFRKNDSGVWGIYSDLLYDTYQKDWSKAYQLTFYCFFRNIDYLSNYIDGEFFSYTHRDFLSFAHGEKYQFGEVIINDVEKLLGDKAKLNSLHGLPKHDKAPLYDIIGKVIDSKGYSNVNREEFRHGQACWLDGGKRYYTDFPKYLSEDTFAHMASAAVVNPKAFGEMKKCLPDSYKMFIEILKIMMLELCECEVEKWEKRERNTQAQDVTERFISILKESPEYVELIKNEENIFLMLAMEKGLNYALKKVLEKLTDEEIEPILNSKDKEYLISRPITYYNFSIIVNTNRKWDLKSTEFKNYQGTGVIISNKHYRIDVPGNVLYGYTGTALEFPKAILLKMAGLAQKNEDKKNGVEYKDRDENSNWDDPVDQEQIKAGIELYKLTKAGKELDAALLDQVFTAFNKENKWFFDKEGN